MKATLRFISVLWFSIILCFFLSSVVYAENTGFILPKGVTVIEDEAFSGCEIMKSVTIPGSVSQIGEDAFFGCVNLTDIYYDGTREQWEEITKDSSNETFSSVSIHAVIVDDWDNLTWMLDYTGQLTIIGSGDMLGFWNDSEAWRAYRTDIYSVVIEEGITSIGQQAFSECSNLTSVMIPSSVKTIDRLAFYGCSSLTSVAIPDGVTEIQSEAFRGSGLTSITIPSSVIRMGWYTFADCNGLTSAGPVGAGCNYEFEWTERIPSSAFSGCDSLTSVTLPATVEYISDYAFECCSNLTTIAIPDGVTQIGEYAFTWCGLTSVTLPSSLPYIGEYSFNGCFALKSVTIPEGVTSIEACAFMDCPSLSSVTIPEGVWHIGDAAFRDCESLTSLTLPKSLTLIGKRAFMNCDCLMNVFYAGTEEEWKNIYVDYPGNDRLNVVNVYYNVIGPITGSQLVTGILRESDGWIIKWQISYDEDSSGNKINAHLYMYLDGSNPSDGSLMLYSLLGNGFLMPWLTDEYGFTKSSFNKITIIGGTSNSFEIISDTFSDYINVERVELTRVRIIQARAFENCTGLTSLTYDSSLTLIGNKAFKNCTNLESIESTSSTSNLAVIGSETFMNTGLTNIPSAESLETVGDRAFANTNISVVVFDQLTSLGEDVFDGCPDIQFYCHYNTKWFQYAIDNNVPFILLVDKQYETWGKATGTISAVEYAKLNKYCNDASGEESREAMENEMYERLHENFPYGHPLHTDDDLRYRSLEREQIQAFRLSSDLQIIRIAIDEENAIVIFAGTRIEQLGDFLQDVGIFLDAFPGSLFATSYQAWIEILSGSQLTAAKTFVQQQIGFGYNVYVTGYSLGGYIAVDVTLNCSGVKECCTIDPPGIDSTDAIFENHSGNAGKITNYCNKYSSVSWVGAHVGTVIWLDVEENWIGPIHNHKIEKTIEAF